MPNALVITNFSLPGISIQAQISRSATGGLPPQEVTLPAGTAGSLTTRTDDDTGVVTAAGHTIQTSDKVDVFWADGVRYGMDATVDGDAVTVNGGAGDALPAESTAVVITEQVVIDLEFDSTDLVLIAVASFGARSHVEFHDGAATVLGRDLPAESPWFWIEDMGTAEPFGSKVIEELRVACGSATAGADFKFGGLYDSTG